jgi:hypothetical protein
VLYPRELRSPTAQPASTHSDPNPTYASLPIHTPLLTPPPHTHTLTPSHPPMCPPCGTIFRYKSGVMGDSVQCTRPLDHSLLVVGYDTDAQTGEQL